MEVTHLDDQGTQPIGAALRMSLAAGEVRSLSARDRNMVAVRCGHPAAALEAEKHLPKPCVMRANLTTGRKLNDVDVRLPRPSSQLRRASLSALKVDDGRELVCERAEENQCQSSRNSRHPPNAPVQLRAVGSI